jgi:hypothetical protein
MRPRMALALALLAVGVCLNGVSIASCAGPSLVVSPAAARSSTVITVEGTALASGGCDDSPGAGGCSPQDRSGHGPTPTLAHGTILLLSVAGRAIPLSEFDPDPNGSRRRQVRLPADLPAGVGELRVLAADGSVIATTPFTIKP